MNDNTEIQEHDIVVVTKDLMSNTVVSVGDEGTVVHIYPNVKAYEVEFAKPNPITVTMHKGEIKRK
jgi:hypothetical protein